MSGIDCPDQKELVEYSLGRLPEETSESVAEHVRTCPKCQNTIVVCGNAEDTWIARLRCAPVADQYEQEPDCRAAVARVKAIAGQVLAKGPELPSETTDLLPVLGSLGEYELLAKLGEGGMGTVYKARHTRLDRIVALKVLPTDRTNDVMAVARFEREMKAIGRLSHPNIVQAHDARDIDGTTILVMEQVEGFDLAQAVHKVGALRIADACELVRQTALGLQYVHEHGLVHRDVKPSNLMLTRQGQVKILDLGLALLGSEKPNGAELTSAGQAMGTANYMAPEQTSDSHRVDIRADIYSLGCTLYKLLTGQVPFRGPNYKTPFDKMMGHARDVVPSVRLARTDVSAELAAVIERMMAKNPAERFAAPAEVADAIGPFAVGADLPRLLTEIEPTFSTSPGEPQVATDPILSSAMTDTKLYGSRLAANDPREAKVTDRAVELRPQPLVRRRRRILTAVAVATLGIFVAFGIVIRIKDREGRETVIRVPEGSQVTLDTSTKESGSDGKAESAVPTIALPKAIQPEPMEHKPGAPLSAKALAVRPAPIAGLHSWTFETGGHRGGVNSVAYSPDGRLLASAGRDGTIRIWEPADLKLLRILCGHGGSVNGVAWSPDNRYLASASEDASVQVRDPATGLNRTPQGGDATVRVWDAATGQLLRTLRGHEGAVFTVTWSPDGTQIASGGADKTLRFWDVASGEHRISLSGNVGVAALAWSRDGRYVAAPVEEKMVAVREVSTRKIAYRLETPGAVVAGTVAFSPDGKLLAVGDNSGAVTLWDMSSGKPYNPDTKISHAGAVSCLAFSPDGTRLVTACADSSVKVWEVVSGGLCSELKELRSMAPGLAWSPDGKTIAFGSSSDGDGAVSTWEVAKTKIGQIAAGYRDQVGLCSVAWSPDGRTIASSGSLTFSFDASLKNPPDFNFLSGTGGGGGLAWSLDGRWISVSCSGGDVRIFDAVTHTVHCVIPPPTDVGKVPSWDNMCYDWSPDGSQLVIGYDVNPGKIPPLSLVDVASGQVVRRLESPGKACSQVAFSPDGKTLAAVDGELAWFCDVSSGKVTNKLDPGQAGGWSSVAYATDGKRMALGAAWGAMVYTISSTGFEGPTFLGTDYACGVGGVTFVDDNRMLVAAQQGRAYAWNIENQKRVFLEGCFQPRGNWSYISGLAWAPDRRIFACATSASMIRFFVPQTGQLLAALMVLGQEEKRSIAFTPEGHYRTWGRFENPFVYVALTSDGHQLTLTADEFAKQYGWKNDPEKVQLEPEPKKEKAEQKVPGTNEPSQPDATGQ